ncbi:MAG: LysR substrate-binding domain-containing protein, partial [Pseudomonadota bacterium]
LTFFASKALAKQYQQGFPQSLHKAPMLLPTQQHEVRQLVDRWLGDKQVYPDVRGEFDDSALIKSFGKAGLGIFFMPSVIADEVCHNFQVHVIGKTDEVKQRFYAISAERKISNPAVNAIIESAQKLF